MSTAESAGVHVGRYAAAFTKPIIWGLLVGGTGLAVLPGGPAIPVTVASALVLGLVKPPSGERLADRSDRSLLFRLAGVTLVAVVAARFDVEPSAFITGAVLHVGFRALRARALVIAAVVLATVVVVSAGALVTDPAALLTSGDPWTLGNAARDLIRYVLLVTLAAALSDDQRRASEVAAARESAVSDERARIARELHDVVAHHVSAMTIQAEAARSALPLAADAKVDGALEAAASSGRTALAELRRLLGVLRAPSTGDDLGPQPTLADLGDLIASASSGGLDVRLDRQGGSVAAVSPAVALSTYRIVQEALANVAKHSRADMAVVTLSTPDDETVDGAAIIVDVRDDGRGASGRSGPGTGFGILGMRERASLVGGTVEAGPAADGKGWHVRAVLPLDAVPA